MRLKALLMKCSTSYSLSPVLIFSNFSFFKLTTTGWKKRETFFLIIRVSFFGELLLPNFPW